MNVFNKLKDMKSFCEKKWNEKNVVEQTVENHNKTAHCNTAAKKRTMTKCTEPSTGDFCDVRPDVNNLRVLYNKVVNLEEKFFQSKFELSFYDDIYFEDETELKIDTDYAKRLRLELKEMVDLHDAAHKRLLATEIKAVMGKQAVSKHAFSIQNVKLSSKSLLRKMMGCFPMEQKSRAERYLPKHDFTSYRVIDEHLRCQYNYTKMVITAYKKLLKSLLRGKDNQECEAYIPEEYSTVGERGMFVMRMLPELERILEEAKQRRIALKRQNQEKIDKNRNAASEEKSSQKTAKRPYPKTVKPPPAKLFSIVEDDE